MAEAKETDKSGKKSEDKPGRKPGDKGRAADASRKPGRAVRSGNPAKAAAAERERQEESRAAANRVSRTPTRIKETGSPRWYAPTMVALMIIGLLWVVTTYLFQGRYPLPYFVENHASDWLLNGNLYIGFVIMMVGFLGLLRWK